MLKNLCPHSLESENARAIDFLFECVRKGSFSTIFALKEGDSPIWH